MKALLALSGSLAFLGAGWHIALVGGFHVLVEVLGNLHARYDG